jgi:hypothetical protein
VKFSFGKKGHDKDSCWRLAFRKVPKVYTFKVERKRDKGT